MVQLAQRMFIVITFLSHYKISSTYRLFFYLIAAVKNAVALILNSLSISAFEIVFKSVSQTKCVKIENTGFGYINTLTTKDYTHNLNKIRSN